MPVGALRTVIKTLKNCAAELNSSKKKCSECQQSHYVDWGQAQASTALEGAITRVEKAEAILGE